MACDSCPVDHAGAVRRVYTMLLLCGYEHAPALAALVGTWTASELEAAYRWAALEHLYANDNVVRRVPRPAHLPAADAWGVVVWDDGPGADAAGLGPH